MSKTRRIVFFSGLFIALLLAVSVARDFSSFAGHYSRLPTWDPSAHGMDGVMLADAVRDLSPVAFFKAIYLMSYWPPVFPLLEMPAFVVRGYDFHVARDTQAFLYVMTVLSAFGAGFFVTESLSLVTGLATAALVAASPFFKLYANLEMAEIPSALFQLLAMAFFFAYETGRTRRALVGFCVSLTLLFFTKYNNGLLVIIALVCYHGLFDGAGRRALLQSVWSFFTSGTWKKPFYLFALIYLVALGVIFVGGGVVFELYGSKVFLRTIGNPLYALIVLTLLRWVTLRRDEGRHLLGLLKRLSDPYRTYFYWVVLPIAVWMVNPNNLRTFFLVVTNEAPDEKRELLTTLAYYPNVILNDYVGSHSLGMAILLFALIPLLWLRKLSRGQKFLYLFGGLSLVLCAIHQNQSPRYIFPLVPLIFVAAAFALTRPLAFLSRQNRLGAATVMTAIIVGCFAAYGRSTEETSRQFDAKTSDPGMTAMIDFICSEAKASQGEATLIGFWDELSPGLVQWRCRQQPNDVPLKFIPQTPNRMGLDYYSPDVAKFLARDDLKEIFVANYQTEPPQDYLMHYRNKWLLPLIDQVEKDPRFTKVAERTFEQPWYRVSVYRRR